jgi:excisionase family DNA binding protein
MTTHTRELGLLTVEEAAQMLRVSTASIRRWIAMGLLPAARVGMRKLYIKREDVLDFVDKNTNTKTTTTDAQRS